MTRKTDRFRQRLVAMVCCSLLCAVAVHGARACTVLAAVPTQTLADRILLSDALVLAREDPDRPFHYAPTTVLKGEPGAAPIDLFLPSVLRRQLASNPDLTVLVAQTGNDAAWSTLGVASDEYLEVVGMILESAERWTPNETDNAERLAALAPLLGHADRRLHELAYLEIGRASYASIRRVGAGVSLERVRSMLDDPLYFQWRGLDIMLLGLSGEARDRDRVIETMHRRKDRSNSLDLAAWATAYVEVTGTDGIKELTQWYLREPGRSRDELRSIMRALAVHSNDDLALRDPVVQAYQAMLETHPRMAPEIAHDLIAWRRWELADQFQQLRSGLAKTDPLGVYQVNLYLNYSRAAQESTSR